MESLLECFSVEILHHDDIVAIKGCDVVNGADVRVVQRRNGPRLMLKTGPRLWVGVEATDATLMATVRRKRLSCARYTSPIPPAPANPRIS